MNRKIMCYLCDSELDKMTIGLNKKLLGDKVKRFYCISCLSDYLETSVEDLLDKAQEFKHEGCKLFL